VSDALSKDVTLLKEVTEINRATEVEEELAELEGTEPKDLKGSDGKLVEKEEIAEGRIKLSACLCLIPLYAIMYTNCALV
jgi:hypothetical protein